MGDVTGDAAPAGRSRVVLGSYDVNVDLSSPDHPQIDLSRVVADPESERAEGLGTKRQGQVSVLSEVSLYGPGSWDAATQRLSASLRVTNMSSGDFDEPRVEVVMVNQPSIVFEGTHGGGSAVGGWYGYADIEAPPGANNASARQNLVIYDPLEVKFSFRIDVTAETGSPASSIFPDADDDLYNMEPESEAAGGDCNDGSVLHHPESTFPCLPPAPAPAGVIACYEFENGAADTTGNGHDGTISSVSYVAAIDGQAVVTQSNSAIRVQHDDELVPSRLSVDMWIRPSPGPSGSQRYGLLEKDNEYGLYLHSSGEVRCLYAVEYRNGWRSYETVLTSAGTGVVAGSWNHVACTFDGRYQRLYINDSEVDSASLPSTATNVVFRNDGGTIFIGEEAPGGSDQFLGEMDRVRIWGQAMTAQEICEGAGTCWP